MTDTRCWVAFNLVPYIGPAKVQRLLKRFGDLKTAWHASHFDLATAGLDKRAFDSLLATRKKIDLDAELEKITRAGARVLTFDNAPYPRLLKNISNPPLVLYVKGEIIPDDDWAVAVVGTWRASAYGRDVTRQIVPIWSAFA